MLYKNQTVRLPIVPPVVKYYTQPGEEKLDYPAICCFAALGFFLDDDTYFTNKKAFRPATEYTFNGRGEVESKKRYFQWHYTPRTISFQQALDEFSNLIESSVQQETAGKGIILPISGGLDSRTLAATVANRSDVFSYSYQFEDGIPENDYGAAIAQATGFHFQGFTIPKGYLWNVIDALAKVNGCYAEFLNPRQMAVYGQLVNKGDIFLLGHGGDLFFDSMGVEDNLTEKEQHEYLMKKLIKPSGWQLAESLWKAWKLPGNFKEYVSARILELLRRIEIDNANARLRAFKTEYYVARWTAVNLELFQQQLPVCVPFFHDDMCRFICNVPESHLGGRKLEIEYLKQKSPSLAKIPWQKVYPCDLYNYSKFDSLEIKIQRAWIKGKRELGKCLLNRRADASNWELQFLGKVNTNQLSRYLIDHWNPAFISKEISTDYFFKFQQQGKAYVHAVTMLLTLALFGQKFYEA
ncbi:MAG TPA: asparagine synthase-related protein [Cyclobacteriaceae bacterium]|nr:asparagine synthase-related protein [Cyclobacteriaceae bacterium]HRJ83294.1 asparagine synthase-related protein [Cyclobacteriaceae bacterium]